MSARSSPDRLRPPGEVDGGSDGEPDVDGFARDYLMRGKIAADRDGRIRALVDVLADHGAFNATAQPTKYPRGSSTSFTGSYDLEAAYCTVKGVYTNKAPGGVAYRCSFRTEAAYLVERMVDLLELGMDPAELAEELHPLRPVPYTTKTGWEYDSGDYHATMRKAMRIAGYDELRREQEKRARGEYMGIGVSFFTETVGAGRGRRWTSPGLGMADGAELRVLRRARRSCGSPSRRRARATRRRSRRSSRRSSGSRPRTSRSCTATPTRRRSASAPTARARRLCRAPQMVARKVREARQVAAAALEVSPDDLEWEKGRWFVKGDPEKGKTIQELALASHGALELPEGVEGHLDAVAVYDPPNLTYPYGASRLRRRRRPGTGEVELRRFIAVDDCGVRINPMIVEGQIHGGIAEGIGIAMMQHIAFDEQGNQRIVHGLPRRARWRCRRWSSARRSRRRRTTRSGRRVPSRRTWGRRRRSSTRSSTRSNRSGCGTSTCP